MKTIEVTCRVSYAWWLGPLIRVYAWWLWLRRQPADLYRMNDWIERAQKIRVDGYDSPAWYEGYDLSDVAAWLIFALLLVGAWFVDAAFACALALIVGGTLARQVWIDYKASKQ